MCGNCKTSWNEQRFSLEDARFYLNISCLAKRRRPHEFAYADFKFLLRNASRNANNSLPNIAPVGATAPLESSTSSGVFTRTSQAQSLLAEKLYKSRSIARRCFTKLVQSSC